MLEFLKRLFDTRGFLPRGASGDAWSSELIYLHVLCDAAAAVALLAVFGFLAFHLLRRRPDPLPKRLWFPVVLLAVAGLMHFMEVWQFFWPAYRFAGLIKLSAAVTAWLALLSFIPFISRRFSGEAWSDLELQIHRRQTAEDRLREAEAAHHSLVESLPLNLFRKDTEGRFVEANGRFCETVGLKANQIIGRTDHDLFPKDQADKYREGDALVLTTGKILEDVEGQTLPSGKKTYVQVLKAPVRDKNGELRGVQGIFWDVTERKYAEDARRLADARFRRLVESSLIGVFVAEVNGTLLDVNNAFLELIGYTRDDFSAGKLRWDELTPTELRPVDERAIESMQSSGHCSPWEKEFTHRDGRRVPVVIGLAPLVEEQGRFICFVLDITERKRFERELREAKEQADAANEAKSLFLANMSHEVRTPMNAIIGLSELLLQTPLQPQQSEYLKIVLESSESLLTVINDVLDFSKVEAGRMRFHHEPFLLRNCVIDSLRPFGIRAHEKGLRLACDIDVGVPDAVIGDPGRLRQVLMNLVGNAVKFTEHGEVVVSVRMEEFTDQEVALHFAVSDTGIGIPEDKFTTIFQAFEQADTSTTRQYGGTGLGLTIVARFVEMMRGRIWVESVVGKGSTFHFTARMSQTDKVPESSRPLANLPQGLRMLVVDDYELNRRIVTAMLHSWHQRSDVAENIEEAWALLRESIAMGDPYRLVLTDVNMPHGDGFALIERMTAEPDMESIPVIVFTSGDQPDELQRCRELRTAGYLLKPLKQSDVFDAIAAALGEATTLIEPGAPLPPALPPLDILLVEDSLVNQKLAIGVLERDAHQVTIACTGVEALKKTEKHRFDVVLMDVQMPEMDGHAATRAIRQRETHTGDHVPIIAMTAHALLGDRERCLDSGMDDYIAKPIRPRQLIEVIARNVDLSRHAPVAAVAPAAPPVAPVVSLAPAAVCDPPACVNDPPVDWEAALAATGGDVPLLCDLIVTYFSERPRLEGELTDALAREDFPLLHRAAHTLKSSMRLFGAKKPYDLSLQLEVLGREKQLDGTRDLFATLQGELEGLTPSLQEYLAKNRV